MTSTNIQIPKLSTKKAHNKYLLSAFYPPNKRLNSTHKPLSFTFDRKVSTRQEQAKKPQFALKSHYPENRGQRPTKVDKGHNTYNFIPKCSIGFVTGECEGGHKYAKLLLCGKDWCPDCGAKNSMIHKRRISRWWGKVAQMKKMGYMVITTPPIIREYLKDPDELTAFRTFIIRWFQRNGYDRGLIRYHWAGEDGIKWAPHLIILVEGMWWSKPKLAKLKSAVCRWMIKRYDFDKKVLKMNINYNYGKPTDKRFEGYKIHKLNYVTRATLTNFDPYYDPKLVSVLKGYRVSSTWGKWTKDQPNTSELASLEAGLCPHPECRKKIIWLGGKDNVKTCTP